MKNYDKELNKKIKESFLEYLDTNSRSNKKLKILHGFINKVFRENLNDEYFIYSLTNESNKLNSKEKEINGIFMDKKADISIFKKINNIEVCVCGIAVKFIMSNYLQNSINYFENMLGETANIRGNNIPYFQIFIIENEVPYFNKDKIITKWEEINENNLLKYKKISFADKCKNLFIPSKILLKIVEKKYSEIDILKNNLNNLENYKDFFTKNKDKFNFKNFNLNCNEWGDGVIINNFDNFVDIVISEIRNKNSNDNENK